MKCPKCSHIGGLYDFPNSIQISVSDFRIFNSYERSKGKLLCKKCKIEHLINIADVKGLSEDNIKYLQKQLKEIQLIW